MSEYDDLKRSVDEQSLIYESYVRQLDAIRLKKEETCRLMQEALVREKKEDAFVPGEAVEVRDLDAHEWRPGKFASKDEEGLFVVKCFMSHKGHAEISWIQCRRPEDREGVFIRHVGNECPVSDKDAKVILLLESGDVRSSRAGCFNWKPNGKIIGYIIVPKWALERVK